MTTTTTYVNRFQYKNSLAQIDYFIVACIICLCCFVTLCKKEKYNQSKLHPIVSNIIWKINTEFLNSRAVALNLSLGAKRTFL